MARTTASTMWTEHTRDVARHSLHMIQGGSGEPLLVLHGEMGHRGMLQFHDALAAHYALTLPMHPGFGRTARVEWVNAVRDLATWYLEALDDLGIEQTAVLGCGLGGWLAAEMAVMHPQRFSKVILANALGLRPTHGEIFDMFLFVAKDYIDRGFANPAGTPAYQQLYGGEPTPEQAETWFNAREESCRLAWRPYMHDLTLPHRLHRLKRVPTLILWGRDDAIVPVSAAEVYHRAIPGSRLTVLEHCGHYPEIEHADVFVQHMHDFLRNV